MTDGNANVDGVTKFATGIPGFEFIADGGLPKARATLLAGSSGSGKSTFSAQFLVEGIRQWQQAGVFVTFEEPPAAVRDNYSSLGWNIRQWEDQGLWAFVDFSPDEELQVVAGEFDLGALLPRIEHAVNRIGAQRLVIDSLGALYTQYTDHHMVRRALGQLVTAVRRMGITTVVTAERVDEYGAIGRFGVEEFVADSVIVLRNALDGDKRRRTAEILKMRGTSHQKGEYPFTISRDAGGVSIIPLSAVVLDHEAGTDRASFGVSELDTMCAGGILRRSTTLIAGPTGTGKSLIASHFLTGDVSDRALLVAFEEGADQIRRNTEGWSLPLRRMERQGTLRIESAYPETASLEDHLIRVKKIIDEFQPKRFVCDSLTALERISSHRSFREFLIALIAHLRERGVTTVFTANTSSLQGSGVAGGVQVSSMTDGIILLRYTEQAGQIKRALILLKMRATNQDQRVREFTIGNQGIEVGGPLSGEHQRLPEFIPM